ncbi:hypothetical protein N7537_007076 [Penicillium hordei]|jgi:hypothetical protein|uniref:Uncharacterized protein n=1 Tax=Penicillium hordei TaxID=40994 RepID=A0AAD6H500_9EURO|nr:uncharacterized protein N7537_007076 [Penicillium hordei]KAJ5604120.1 hypothetical protein N7537_007076 [Penicillium hordei]
MNHGNKVFDIYGDGLQKVTLTSLGDAARAVLALLKNSIKTGADLPPVTHLAGQTLTYKALFEVICRHHPVWKSYTVSISEVLDSIHEGLNSNDTSVAIHQMRILGFTNANHNPDEKVLRWGTGVLEGLYPISVDELLAQAEAGSNK